MKRPGSHETEGGGAKRMHTGHERSHLVVLVHGFLGSAADFVNFEAVVKDGSHSGDFVVMTVQSNGGWFGTVDGVSSGARRAHNEVMMAVEANKDSLKRISIIGHSLGGIYARYLAYLLDQDGMFEKLEPCVFTTLATPHLGVRRPLNTPFNFVFQKMLLPILPTTRELGLMDCPREPLLYRMSTSKAFLDPLKKFQRKALYANIKHDTQVPYSTASIRFKNPYASKSPPLAESLPSDSEGGDSSSSPADDALPSPSRLAGRKSKKQKSACPNHSKMHPNITQWSLDHVDTRRHWKSAQQVEPGVLVETGGADGHTNSSAGAEGDSSSSALQTFVSQRAFRKDALKNKLQEMLFHLDVVVGDWERYDVSFSSMLAHEQIINKKAYLEGKSIVLHFLDQVLIPTHIAAISDSAPGSTAQDPKNLSRI